VGFQKKKKKNQKFDRGRRGQSVEGSSKKIRSFRTKKNGKAQAKVRTERMLIWRRMKTERTSKTAAGVVGRKRKKRKR